MCEIKNHRSKIKDLEIKAKEMEKTDPTQAIELYNKLNILNPNLKKYDKRIEKLNKKWNKEENKKTTEILTNFGKIKEYLQKN